MDEYAKVAGEAILGRLLFSEAQLGLVGKVLSLKEEQGLVSSTEIVEIGNFYFGETPEVRMEVSLQGEMRDEGHDILMDKIRGALKKREVNYSKLFSYCEKSYGLYLDKEGVGIHFGFSR